MEPSSTGISRLSAGAFRGILLAPDNGGILLLVQTNGSIFHFRLIMFGEGAGGGGMYHDYYFRHPEEWIHVPFPLH